MKQKKKIKDQKYYFCYLLKTKQQFTTIKVWVREIVLYERKRRVRNRGGKDERSKLTGFESGSPSGT